MSNLFQIYDADLEILEHDCAALCDDFSKHLTNKQRVRFRRIKDVLSNVRWNYGPHLDSETIDGTEDTDHE